MKYQRLNLMGTALIGSIAAVSAKLDIRAVNGQCPVGYSPSVYYITVTPTSSATSTVKATTLVTSSSSSSWSSVSLSSSAVAVEPTSSTFLLTTSTSSLPAPAPTTETPLPDTATQAAVPTTSSTAEAVFIEKQALVATSAAEESTSSTSVAQAISTTSAASSSSTASVASSGSSSGSATFYGGNVDGGACSFSSYTLPSGIFGTALSAAQWADSGNCGACVAIKGPNGKTIKAMVVDQCPGCATGHFDLFQNAFAELADISKGVIDIDWSWTSCDVSGPLKLRNKSGSSSYWFAMQVVNANEAVTKLEVSTDGGSSWESVARTTYNYFVKSGGFGTDTVDVRLTGESGNTVTVENVSCSSTSEFTADSNL